MNSFDDVSEGLRARVSGRDLTTLCVYSNGEAPTAEVSPVISVNNLLFLLLLLPVVLAYLGWTRYLYYRETLAMLEKGANLDAFLEMRERWRIRSGLLYGMKLVLGGCLILLMMVPAAQEVLPRSRDPEHYFGFIGVFLAILGIATIVAYAIWSRHAGGAKTHAAPKKDDDAEQTNDSAGRMGL